ncbi:hypothetical protein HZU75_08650 [Chitinibacter fontanus]|uniref:Lipoprotein n=1 Tax=Chitinibacter fontanus TaxID=1737446 RepID=A0A7D5V9V9_9NEIS|nr:hypothetical protein [Chitinibacter fontanus]QLI81594.1 hypothetical protein HZU75_08650 [Chitinibacter fontanus]
MTSAVTRHHSKRWVIVPTFLLAGLLTACEQANQITQQAASSVVALVGSEVKKQTDGVIDQVTQEANQVLQPLGLDASQIASSVKAQTVQLAQQVLKSNGDWAQLVQYKGRFPADIGLFTEVSPIMPELKGLLGDQLGTLLGLMSTPSSIQFDRVLYVLGNKPQATNADSAWLSIDAENRKLEVGLIRNGTVKVYQSKGEPIYRPAEVAQLIEKHSKGIAK